LVVSGLCAGLKNEGSAFAVCLLLLAFAAACRQRRAALFSGWPHLSVIVTAVSAFAGLAIWSGWRAAAGIANDLADADSKLERFTARFEDGQSLGKIWRALHSSEDVSVLKLLLGIAIVFWCVNWRELARYRAALLFGLAVPTAYLAVLLLVYLTTPMDLHWHLSTSADRTSLVLHACWAMGLIGPIVAET
jgi:hypothetical protein